MLREIIEKKFKMSAYSNVREWYDATKCPLSHYTCTSVILQSREPGISSFIVMAYLLDVPIPEIAAACKASDSAEGKLFAEILIKAAKGK